MTNAQAQANDFETFKHRSREQWDRAAAGWDSHTDVIRSWLSKTTEAMLDMAGITSGSRVIDIAAGAGDQSLAAAARVGDQGHVLATDISGAILDFAAARAAAAGLRQIETQVADGENLPVKDREFDAAICRLGLMLFPDPLKGLREMHRALRPGGGACTVVFSRPERNPCIGVLMSTALKHAGLPPRDPFQPGSLLSLGKPGLIDELFRQAGFSGAATTVISAPFRMPSARHYLDFIRSSASPVLQILGSLPADRQQAAWDEMQARLSPFATPDGWEGPNELLITAAKR
jgi:ubiquinone/menaquinone biosynthesis C-methylase UbiE